MKTREECIEYCEMFLNTLAKIKSEDIEYLTSMIEYLKIPDESIDYDSYDPARDADETKGHLCNSLNCMEGLLRHAPTIQLGNNHEVIAISKEGALDMANYFYRAQATIWYLRRK